MSKGLGQPRSGLRGGKGDMGNKAKVKALKKEWHEGPECHLPSQARDGIGFIPAINLHNRAVESQFSRERNAG